MIGNGEAWIIIIVLILFQLYIQCQSSTTLTSTSGTTATGTTGTGSTGTGTTRTVTTGTGTTGTGSTAGSTTNTPTSSTDIPTTTELATKVTTDNVKWMIIGIVCGVFIVILAVVGAALAFSAQNKKRIHPDTDTESICSTYDPSNEDDFANTRPTTASHIHFDDTGLDEAMSKPVSMTPFELRKLYIETFPYANWRKGFDGSLKPHMGLKFVDPKLYSQSKGEISNFRDNIYNYEMSDSLTLRSAAVSRMMRRPVAPASTLPPLPERPFQGDQPNEETNVFGDEAEL